MVTKAKDFSSERFWDSEDLYQSRFLQIKAFAMKGLGRWTGQDQSLPRAISQQLPYHLA